MVRDWQFNVGSGAAAAECSVCRTRRTAPLVSYANHPPHSAFSPGDLIRPLMTATPLPSESASPAAMSPDPMPTAPAVGNAPADAPLPTDIATLTPEPTPVSTARRRYADSNSNSAAAVLAQGDRGAGRRCPGHGG